MCGVRWVRGVGGVYAGCRGVSVAQGVGVFGGRRL